MYTLQLSICTIQLSMCTLSVEHMHTFRRACVHFKSDAKLQVFMCSLVKNPRIPLHCCCFVNLAHVRCRCSHLCVATHFLLLSRFFSMHHFRINVFTCSSTPELSRTFALSQLRGVSLCITIFLLALLLNRHCSLNFIKPP